MSFEFSPQMPPRPKLDHESIDRLNLLIYEVTQSGEGMSPFALECFKDPDLYGALPELIKSDREALKQLMMNMAKFNSLIHVERKKRWSGDQSGLLAEEITLDETQHADGRKRRSEAGYRIHVEYLRSQGIDPKKVLFFRTTQPSDTPKPEYYWTSDYFETRRGLRQEIPTEQRRQSITLVADLETIAQNGGLITDINDDSGLAVRQIGTGPFDQSLVLATIKAKG